MNFLLGGDFRFFWPENIGSFSHMPYAWDSSLNTGIGVPDVNTLWITSYLNLTSYFSYLGFSWNLISIFFWIIPIVLISFASSFFLFKTVANKNNLLAAVSGIIYTTNTYFLSVFLGGQSGVAFAYAFIPLVFLTFYKLLNKPRFLSSLLFSLAFSLEVLFDPRFAFLTLLILLLYYLFKFRLSFKNVHFIVLVPLIITALLHSFWILPLILFRTNIIPKGFESILGVQFFSFAFLENSISLLHPNWPENIFGKVSFMKPEFLIIPILAFASLLFINNWTKKHLNKRAILSFALIGLVGAFLAKGVNEPFGEIFVWLFENITGFSLFRDPTKFYALVAFSYSILIPFTLFSISDRLKRSLNLIVFFFVVFWAFTLRGLFLTDTNLLKARSVPESYSHLKNFIVDQNSFFRTLWIPQWQRYGYFSDRNPAIGRGEIFKEASASGMIRELSKEGSLEDLQNIGIKYVIIPEDSEEEIFLDDRKYSEKEYAQTLNGIRKVNYLKELPGFGKIKVFEVPNPKDRYSSPNKDLVVEYNFVNPTQYLVSVKNARQGDILVFSEGYDRNWSARNSEFRVQSSEFRRRLNSFELPKEGDYTLEIYYEPQQWVNIGLMISGLTLAFIILYLVRSYRKR